MAGDKQAARLADLPVDELRARLLDHLDTRQAVPINIADLREMVEDDDGLEIVREALRRADA